MRVIGGILVLFNIAKLVKKSRRQETIHKMVREAEEKVRETRNVYPPALPIITLYKNLSNQVPKSALHLKP